MQGTSGPIICAMHMTDGLLHLKPHLLEVWDKGCSELYQELGQYAELCHPLFEQKWSTEPVEAPGVYDYEVSCEFGDWFGKYILEHEGEAPLYCTCYRVLNELADEFWSHAEDFSNRKGTNMGTRSITRLHITESQEEICVLYRQMDGYPEGHGKELASFLEGFTIVNGYNPDTKGKVANGAHCLAAQIIAHFKNGVGEFYLYPAGTDDMGEEYIYDVECSVLGGVTLHCREVEDTTRGKFIEKFVGTPEEYKDWVTMLEDI